MKRLRRWLIAILLAVGLCFTAAPIARAAYFNEDIWGAVATIENRLAACSPPTGAVLLSESEVAFGTAKAVGSDEAIRFFWTLWQEMPANLQQRIDNLKKLIAQGESYGYKMAEEKACLQVRLTYSIPNVANAVPVAARAVVNNYVDISVVAGEVVATPKFDRVAVQSAALDQSGKPTVTIQVTDSVNGQAYQYTSSYPPIVVPVEPPVPPKVFSKTYAPTISGTTKVGRTLSASSRYWSPRVTAKAWRWQRNGVDIAGATSYKYKLAADDLGSTITVKLTGSKAGYNSVTTASKPTKIVTPGSITRGPVKVKGSRHVGATLSAYTPRWTAGALLAKQWTRNGVAVPGATGDTYVLGTGDYKARFRVVVSATAPGYYDARPKASQRTGNIRKGYLAKVTPVVSGTIQVGETLTVDPGAWKPNGVTFKYQWYRGSRKISGATAASYTLTTKELGKYVRVKVTGKLAYYYDGYKYSKWTAAKVTPAPPEPAPEPAPGTP